MESAANALAAGADGLTLKSEPACDLTLRRGNDDSEPFGITGLLSPTPNGLSPRELETFRSLERGDRNKKLAWALGISAKTLNAHCSSIVRKLKLRNYSDLIQFAIRLRGKYQF